MVGAAHMRIVGSIILRCYRPFRDPGLSFLTESFLYILWVRSD